MKNESKLSVSVMKSLAKSLRTHPSASHLSSTKALEITSKAWNGVSWYQSSKDDSKIVSIEGVNLHESTIKVLSNSSERIRLYEELALLLNHGVSVSHALSLLKQAAHLTQEANRLFLAKDIEIHLEKSKTLSSFFQCLKPTHPFEMLLIEMAEKSGSLSNGLRSAIQEAEKNGGLEDVKKLSSQGRGL